MTYRMGVFVAGLLLSFVDCAHGDEAVDLAPVHQENTPQTDAQKSKKLTSSMGTQPQKDPVNKTSQAGKPLPPLSATTPISQPDDLFVKPVIGGIKTWKEALSQAYASNPDLKIAQAELRKIQEGKNIAWSEWIPQLNVTLSQQASQNKRTETKVDGYREAGLSLEQSLFSSGASLARLKSAHYNTQSALMSLVAAENKVLLEAINAFLDVWLKQEILKIRNQDEANSQMTLEQVEAQFHVGSISQGEVLSQQAKRSASTAARVKAEGDLNYARGDFERIIGKEPSQELTWPEDLPIDIVESLEELIARGLRESPSVLGALDQERAAERDVYATTADQILPSVKANASATRRLDRYKLGEGTANEDTANARNLSVMFSLTVPIPTGRQQAQVRAGQNNLTKISYQRQIAQRIIRSNMLQAYAQMQATFEATRQFDREVTARKQAYQGLLEEWNLGSKSITDVRLAQYSLVESQTQRVQNKKDLIMAKVQIKTLLGQFLTKNLRLKVHQYNPEAYDPWFTIGVEERAE